MSRVCEAIKDEFDAWKQRDLADVSLEYLYLDGSHFRYHDGARAEPVLASRGWRGVVMTPAAVRQLQGLRAQLFGPTTAEEVITTPAEAVTPAA